MNNMVIARDTENQVVFYTGKAFSHEYPDTEFFTKLVANRIVELIETSTILSGYCDVQTITKSQYGKGQFC